MRNHTIAYEEAIKTFGRQQAIRITFGNVVLTGDDINSCTPSFKASLLKSCMKEVRIDSNTEIPVGTEIHLEHGILVGNNYEYLDYGYYTVYKVEKKEDTSSFDILCYDKMILAMVDYIDLEINFPITIRNYIAEICNHLEIDFGSNQDQFVNYDKEINGELYLDENGDSLGYTFRDVLDEIAQVTASVICIDNENKLVVKYPERQGEFETLEGTVLYIENADDTKIDLELKGNTTQDGTPTPSSPVPVNNVTGEQVVKVCGKNLFDYKQEPTLSLNNATSTIIENGLRIQSTNDGQWKSVLYRTNIDLREFEGKKITLSLNMGNPSGSNSNYVAIGNCDLTGTQRSAIGQLFRTTGYTTKTVIIPTVTASKPFLYIVFSSNGDGTGVAGDYVDYTNIQIEQSTSATSYEEYQGKDYEVNLGKNLANPSNFKFYTQANASCSYDYDTNTLTMTTLVEITSNALFFCSKIDDNLLKNGKTYILSNVNVSGVVNSLKLQLRNKDGTNASKPQGTTITYDNNYSLFIVGNPFASSGSTVVPQGSVAVIKDIQVEERKCSN